MAARITLTRYLLLAALGLLVLRLVYLQLLRGSAYRKLADQNCLRLVPQAAPRGLILDRVGRALAANRTGFRLAVVPQDLPAIPRKSARPRHQATPPWRGEAPRDSLNARDVLFGRLGVLTSLSPDELESRFEEGKSSPFLPTPLIDTLSKTTALRLEEEHLSLPGVVVESTSVRQYPLGPVAAHLIGYISQPSPEDFPVLKEYGVRPKELVGRAGLEREFDTYLRGRVGGSLIEVDSRGRQVRVIGHREPVPGQPLVLTIDAALQEAVERQLGQQAGACVVLKPQTGEVLAMASHPSFDPEAFATQQTSMVVQWLEDPGAPFMNRATVGVYPPGSIVKPITALAALEQRLITRDSSMVCAGHLGIGDRRFHCWKRDGHGPVTVRDALMKSCNVYFMDVGRRLGFERLRVEFTRVGFGKRTGWLLQEQPGHLPGDRHLSEGEVAMLAMGQSEILVTPLQAAVMVSAIANSGWVVEPWVVKRVGDHEMSHSHRSPLGWSQEALAVVREGMVAVVNDPHGTGIRAHSEQVRIAGKTGTAQTHVEGKTHAWFTGFCPIDQPVAALAIVAEYGGSGGDVPAAMGKAICEYVAAHSL